MKYIRQQNTDDEERTVMYNVYVSVKFEMQMDFEKTVNPKSEQIEKKIYEKLVKGLYSFVPFRFVSTFVFGIYMRAENINGQKSKRDSKSKRRIRSGLKLKIVRYSIHNINILIFFFTHFLRFLDILLSRCLFANFGTNEHTYAFVLIIVCYV